MYLVSAVGKVMCYLVTSFARMAEILNDVENITPTQDDVAASPKKPRLDALRYVIMFRYNDTVLDIP